MRIVALAGGIGGARFLRGLQHTAPQADITVIGNTGDDISLFGLRICPDLDTVMYTLAELAGPHGWGIDGDTFAALEMLGRYGEDIWFQIGDRDLATHLTRTAALRRGERLTDITARLATQLGIHARILPSTDDTLSTRLLVAGAWVDFQDYFVRRRHGDPVDAVRYDGISAARLSPEAEMALSEADAIILVNSNPVLSILPILGIGPVNDLVAGSAAPRVAVSPIVGSSAVTGPAGDLMSVIGYPSTATGVAQAYLGAIDGIVIDRADADQQDAVEALGPRVLVTNTIMQTVDDRERLAVETVEFARSLR
jgi:LPPG:FO 2-phospho-L-lactate transferase